MCVLLEEEFYTPFIKCPTFTHTQVLFFNIIFFDRFQIDFILTRTSKQVKAFNF